MTQKGGNNSVAFEINEYQALLGYDVARGDIDGGKHSIHLQLLKWLNLLFRWIPGCNFVCARTGRERYWIFWWGKDLTIFAGSPQRGGVFLYHGSKNRKGPHTVRLSDNNEKEYTKIEGKQDNSRFGFAVESFDYNLDGYDDLVASAPGIGSDSLTYRGEVYIFLGSPSGIQSEDPQITIVAECNYTNLGKNLCFKLL
jgi:hypothetical protein